MKRIVIAVALATSSIFLVGCGGTSVSEDTQLDQTPLGNVQQFDLDSGGDTYVFKTVIDGTECVVADTYEGVAIWCVPPTMGPVAP